ncbi:hypothetical protein LBMAG10_05010 [Actinomycetes bacterium]|nr:hypothetical protein [Actinomycetota bacterium]GDX23836.1 hypothetical protein LBMAG10_05010 [Actinomycetes bacterium]
MKSTLAAALTTLLGLIIALSASVRVGSLLVSVALLIIAGERFRDRNGVTVWRSRSTDLLLLVTLAVVIATLALLLPNGG